jgi:hypothetical protein
MAIIPYTKRVIAPSHVRITWPGLGSGDEGQPVDLAEFPDRSMCVTGTFDGAEVAMVGSIDEDDTYLEVHDPSGNPLTFTEARLEQILETTQEIKPTVTGGSGSTSIKVTLFLRAPR